MAQTEIYPALIKEVISGSPAQRAGVRAGDQLLMIDGESISDILAYRHKLERGKVLLTVAQTSGSSQGMFATLPQYVAQDHHILKADNQAALLEFEVEWEDPGLEFEEVLFDGIKKCANKCDFCYIHQMPRGFRKSLYIMDDDYRLSFLYGSFVTLTNLSEEDINRILNENLSPLYVSVHTTNQEKRQDMMKWWKLKVKDAGATDIQSMIDRLESIDLYTQIVMLPERNDGDTFDETLEFLSSKSNVISVAAVPVGLTTHRDNLATVLTFNPEQAQDVLKRANTWRKKMLLERGTRFIFPSDEFYLLAGEPLPSEEEYEGFPMLENGVGMIRDFLGEDLPELPLEISPRRIIVATGTLFAPSLKIALEPLSQIRGLELEVRAVPNKTFGEATTVAGLLTGRCMRHGIKPAEADLLIVPPTTLRYGTELMLDDVSLSELALELKMKVVSGGTTLGQLAKVILGESASSLPQFGYSTHAVKEASRGQA
jgi:putative radical SAM enzyme (TIGR03279 family)